MNKFTPGPWKYDFGAASILYEGTPLQIIGSDGMYIAKVDSVKGRNYAEGKNLGNAQLIAAAPELLDALVKIVETCELMMISLPPYTYINTRGGYTRAVSPSLLDVARTVIAKAKGEDQ